ncbi:15644_t:CDS:1, partial [Gigaspora margarita]
PFQIPILPSQPTAKMTSSIIEHFLKHIDENEGTEDYYQKFLLEIDHQ